MCVQETAWNNWDGTTSSQLFQLGEWIKKIKNTVLHKNVNKKHDIWKIWKLYEIA